MTKKELGEYLRVSRWVIERLMREGFPFIRLGHKIMFRREDVDRWLESKIIKKPGPAK